MKKLIPVIALLVLLTGAALAVGTQVYGLLYAPAVQTDSSLSTSAVETVYTDTNNLSPYMNRMFIVNNTGAYTVGVTIEASMDKTTWATIDATSLACITATKEMVAEVVQNCMPYWRLRAISIGTASSVSVYAIMSTN